MLSIRSQETKKGLAGLHTRGLFRKSRFADPVYFTLKTLSARDGLACIIERHNIVSTCQR